MRASAAMRLDEPVQDAVVHPTDLHPRWRLRVFDLCWPWRATRREAMLDAIRSDNAWIDREGGGTAWLGAAANIQRDPPHLGDRLRYEALCQARGVTPRPRRH